MSAVGQEGPLSKIGREIGKLCEVKHDAYGHSFEKTGRILELLYPDGIPKSEYGNAAGVIRTLDKLCRIAAGKDGVFGESAWRDVAGYGILGTAMKERLLGLSSITVEIKPLNTDETIGSA